VVGGAVWCGDGCCAPPPAPQPPPAGGLGLLNALGPSAAPCTADTAPWISSRKLLCTSAGAQRPFLAAARMRSRSRASRLKHSLRSCEDVQSGRQLAEWQRQTGSTTPHHRVGASPFR
jgi:hypothetical protein